MLSYQHGYHAGNRVDVLKHSILEALLAAAPPRTLYVETHAGRGVYDLHGPEARKLGEAADGVLAFQKGKTPVEFEPWLARISKHLPHAYPGSPALALDVLSADARAVFFELHPAEHAALEAALGKDVRVQIKKTDGFAGSLTLHPRSGEQIICLVDPSYETKSDTAALDDWLPTALRRWPQAQVAIWVPLYRDGREADLLDWLAEAPNSVCVTACWPNKPNQWSSLCGTAMVLIGAPKSVCEKAVDLSVVSEVFWRSG